MATKTSNYEFNKPEQNDFYDVDVQNENWDKVDEELSEFDDSGVTEDIKSFPDFLSKFVTGNKVAITLRNLKAGLQFVLHAGQIVNNCVTDNTGLPLSAAQGKVLKDLIDTTNNNLSNSRKTVRIPTGITTGTNILKLDPGFYIHEDNKASNQDKLNMGLPVASWHSHIHVFGYWSNAEKTNGYLTFIVEDMADKTAGKIYYRALSWDSWTPWKVISLTDFSSIT